MSKEECITDLIEDVVHYLSETISKLPLSAEQESGRQNLMARLQKLHSTLSPEAEDSPVYNFNTIMPVPAAELVPEWAGWLWKKRKPGGIKEKWAPQKRWCCIKNGLFYYYLDDLSPKQQGAFCTTGYHMDITSRKNEFWFKLTRPASRTYEFRCPEERHLVEIQDALQETNCYRQSKGPLLQSAFSPPPLPPRNLPGGNSAGGLVDEPPQPYPEEDYDEVDVDPRSQPVVSLKPTRSPHGIPVMPSIPTQHENPSVVAPRSTSPTPEPKRPAFRPFGPVTPTPPALPSQMAEEDDDSDSNDDSDYDEGASEIKPPTRPRATPQMDIIYDDEGFSSQASDRSSVEYNKSVTSSTALLPTKRPLPATPEVNPTSSRRPSEPVISRLPGRAPQLPPRPQKPSQTEELTTSRCTLFQRLYLARWDFKPEYPDELLFRRGDLIKVLDSSNDHQLWWTGKLDGRTGLVPKTYLTPVYVARRQSVPY